MKIKVSDSRGEQFRVLYHFAGSEWLIIAQSGWSEIAKKALNYHKKRYIVEGTGEYKLQRKAFSLSGAVVWKDYA